MMKHIIYSWLCLMCAPMAAIVFNSAAVGIGRLPVGLSLFLKKKGSW